MYTFFYVFYVQQLLKYEQDRSKRVAVTKNCAYTCILIITKLFGFIL